jgi:hypothetical protein
MVFTNNDNIQMIALMAIHKKGYMIRIDKTMIFSHMDKPLVQYIAEKEGCIFRASSYLDLFGLIILGEERGEEWMLNEYEDRVRRKAIFT